MTIAPVHADGNIALRADGRLEGRARRVPFARHARHIAVLVRPAAGRAVALVATSDLPIRQDRSLAGEPRDNVVVRRRGSRGGRRCRDRRGHDPALRRRGAAAADRRRARKDPRAIGANTRSTASSSAGRSPSFRRYSTTLRPWPAKSRRRVRPPISPPKPAPRAEPGAAEIAIAKVRGGEAAGTGAAIAHQVHGAMGFTYEHSLHHATRRLWSWREEFGNETVWATRLGRMVAAAGADRLWPFVTKCG